MWSLLYANRKCNDHEQFIQHKMHLERITNIKSSVKVKEPKKPSFLFRKAKKEQMERGRQTISH